MLSVLTLALFVADYYARPNKNGGAWASAYVPQSGLLGTKPVIANHLNIPPPPLADTRIRFAPSLATPSVFPLPVTETPAPPFPAAEVPAFVPM